MQPLTCRHQLLQLLVHRLVPQVRRLEHVRATAQLLRHHGQAQPGHQLGRCLQVRWSHELGGAGPVVAAVHLRQAHHAASLAQGLLDEGRHLSRKVSQIGAAYRGTWQVASVQAAVLINGVNWPHLDSLLRPASWEPHGNNAARLKVPRFARAYPWKAQVAATTNIGDT